MKRIIQCIIILTLAIYPFECVAQSTQYNASEIVVDMKPDSIKFYIKGSDAKGNEYLRYELRHQTAAFDKTGKIGASNYDQWRLYEVYVVTRTGEFSFTDKYKEPIVVNGEWECALKESGAADFMGGSTHGDEILTNVSVYFDDKSKKLNTTEKFICKKIEFVQTSILYRVFTKTAIANHYKLYEISAGQGIKLYQKIRWLESVKLDSSYLTMFPIKRTLYSDTSVQITDRFKRSGDEEAVDISTPKLVSTNGACAHKSNITKAEIWGEDSGVSAIIEILKRPNIPTESMFMTNAKEYNKVYFDICSNGYSTKKDETMEMETVFKLDVK
jgi:hypothetical protein